jgi:hypothetical protein
MTKIITVTTMILVTPEAGAKHDLLFNEPTLGVSFLSSPLMAGTDKLECLSLESFLQLVQYLRVWTVLGALGKIVCSGRLPQSLKVAFLRQTL